MKKILLLSLVLLFSFFTFFVLPKYLVKKDNEIVSPLPDFLTVKNNNQVSTLELWKPVISQFFNSFSSVRTPEITAKSALVYDLTTDKLIYQKNPNSRLPIASLTKVMTAIVALENPKDYYLVHATDLVGEDSVGLSAGESFSLEELLYGLILHSGNDAAETIASNYPQGRTAFIKAMNEKANSLGLSDTHFTNPTGLEGDGDQYSTAADLLVISRYAINNFPTFDKVSATFDYTISQNSYHKEYILENETNLISSYPGVKGIKTGFTNEAGLCLITYLDYKGHKIIAIMLNSQNRRQEMKDLLDYSLLSEGIDPPKHQ